MILNSTSTLLQQTLSIGWYAFIHLLLAYTIFAYYVYTQHEKHFGGERLTRKHKDCPTSTNMDPPEVKKWKKNQDRILAMSKLHEQNFATCELLEDVEKANHDRVVTREQRLMS